jgi:hypothetical protein
MPLARRLTELHGGGLRIATRKVITLPAAHPLTGTG